MRRIASQPPLSSKSQRSFEGTLAKSPLNQLKTGNDAGHDNQENGCSRRRKTPLAGAGKVKRHNRHADDGQRNDTGNSDP
jgi:hypothetical protein